MDKHKVIGFSMAVTSAVVLLALICFAMVGAFVVGYMLGIEFQYNAIEEMKSWGGAYK